MCRSQIQLWRRLQSDFKHRRVYLALESKSVKPGKIIKTLPPTETQTSSRENWKENTKQHRPLCFLIDKWFSSECTLKSATAKAAWKRKVVEITTLIRAIVHDVTSCHPIAQTPTVPSQWPPASLIIVINISDTDSRTWPDAAQEKSKLRVSDRS